MNDKTPTPDDNDADTKSERIAKRIARSGVCSRRDAERMIEEGLVKLNGKVLDTPAVTVTDEDEIYVNGKPLPAKEKPRLWRLFKKRGLVTSHRDEQGRDTVFEHLPSYVPRVISVGRLDLNSEGLLLLTNDGELARYLELPATGWARRYRVRVHGRIEESKLKQLEDGVTVDGVHYGSIHAEVDVQKDTNAWMTVTLREGKNREIRRVMEHLGWPVTRLMRVSYGPFQLGGLAPGDCEEITGKVMKEQLAAFFRGDYSKVSEKKSVARGGTGRPKAPRTVFGQPAQRKRPQGGPGQNPNSNTNTNTHDDEQRDSRAGRPSLGRPGAGRSYARPSDRSEGERHDADRDGANARGRGNDGARGGARDDKRSASSRSDKPRIGAAPRPGGRGKPAASNARPERDDRDERNDRRDRSSGRPTDKGRGRYASGGTAGSDKHGRGKFAGSDARDGRGKDAGRDGTRDSGNRDGGARGTGPRGGTGGRSSNARDDGGRASGSRDGGASRGAGARGNNTRDGARDTGRDGSRDGGRRDGAGFAGGRGKPGGKPAGRSGNNTSTPGRKPAGNRPRGKKD